MIPSAFDYQVATDVADAERLVLDGGEDAKLLAGGMSLIPLMKLRLAQPTVLVDIGGLDSLRYIRAEGDRVRIGALTRHADLVQSDVVRDRLPLLAAVAAEVGDRQVRARGTIGGVLAHADSAGDFCTVALMLDAVVVTSRRRIPARDFFLDFMTTPLDIGELVVEVDFPAVVGPHSYVKFRRRKSDWAIVGVAAQQAPDGWRIGLTSVGSTVVKATSAERVLNAGGTAADAAQAAADQVHPTGDAVTPSEYKKALVRVLTVRALAEAVRM